ncbi:cytochrome c biogenesis protein CcsA [Planctomicrobium sp. SH664]|uniref:cytochrome c biogenesis protein n=1 Tax=Planctomicrobium sp. SH664 TaxID=3448125 RepID=UPI003F5C3A2B
MAISELPIEADHETPVPPRVLYSAKPGLLVRALLSLASLKLTVALFAAAILIVLFGTLAQVYDDIWEVMRTYFRVDFRELFTGTFPYINLSEVFVWIEPKLFFPPAFFPREPVFPRGMEWMGLFWPRGLPQFPSWVGFWFPKGWWIGALMLINLFAAHLVRFKVQAKGSRLFLGWGTIAFGALVTLGVISSGSSDEGLQAKPLIGYDTMWWFLQTSLFGLCAVCIYAAASSPKDQKQQRWVYGVLAVMLGIASMIAFRSDAASEATMRILYQVIKATVAGVVLLAGCMMVFKKRAGIVLLHAGIGLMMLFDVLVGMKHIESQMQIVEGETVNYSRDTREIELAIVDHSDPERDRVQAIDRSLISRDGSVVKDPRLPFNVEVLRFYGNAIPRSPKSFGPMETVPENLATAGIGQQLVADPRATSTGTDAEAAVDVPAAYVKLTTPAGADLGVYLLSPYLDFAGDNQTVRIGDKSYDIALRFRRYYNDYAITLNDVQKNDYQGTDRPKDYSSFITLSDPGRDTTFDHRIWMNNPMRYAGKTYYQQSYAQLQEGEMTTLQVVDNYGWMTPYVACMMVVVGMLYHFGETLRRFLSRRAREQDVGAQVAGGLDAEAVDRLRQSQRKLDRIGWIVTGVVTSLVALVFVAVAMPRHSKPEEFNLAEFRKLPMLYKGRAMPLDTFARNSLMQLSDRQSFKDSDDPKARSQPAIVWLLDLMADKDPFEHRVIRIENESVREAIGVPKREKMAYSLKDLQAHADVIIKEAQKAKDVAPKDRTLFQRKMYELANRVLFYSFLQHTLGDAPELPQSEPREGQSEMERMTVRADQFLRFIAAGREALAEASKGFGPLPLVVPTHLDAGPRPKIEALNTEWEPLSIAQVYDQFYSEFPAPHPPALDLFLSMLKSYKAGEPKEFNQQLEAYRALLAKHSDRSDLPVTKVNFEAWYNQVDAYNLCSWMYVFAFALAVAGWLCWPQVFGRTAFWLTVFVFCIHTAALIARIYISGRPPVTNLYSSAIFIGWAVVLAGLIIESITRLGAGTVVATIAGFVTLRIAHALAADGDTFVVLEAVLDTQFWLATHVVCITLGYATTYLAGLLGVLYVILGVLTRRLVPQMERELTRMTYGAVCFALFFSFWGTVLGGLWADDSWGRFWGWDPKENGALIIVLWNALMLHARWGNLVRDRGFALLAILGNIVVSWSWFGVNELGVGLHSYGFTEGRLLYLALFVMSQMALVMLGLLPQKLWRSSKSLPA